MEALEGLRAGRLGAPGEALPLAVGWAVGALVEGGGIAGFLIGALLIAALTGGVDERGDAA